MVNNHTDNSLNNNTVQNKSLFRTGLGITIAATKYGAIGGFASSYFSDRNKGAIILGAFASSALAVCCNFAENLKQEQAEQLPNQDYHHTKRVVSNKINYILGRNNHNREPSL